MPHTVSRKRRGRSIRFGIITSLVSKGSSAVLQFLSLPLAARVLGREEFGIYATISLSVFMVSILELGVGPALGRTIAEASAEGDRSREGQLFVSGSVLIIGLILLGTLLVTLLLTMAPLTVLFGEKYAPFEDIMRPALWLGVALMAGQIIVEMTDRVREGYMEAGIVNAWASAGNLAGAIVVFFGVSHFPSVSFLLLAVFGPNILARVANMILLLRKRPWLISARKLPDRETLAGLIGEGLSFTATSFLVYLVDSTICALVIGRISGPADVAVFHVLLSITTAFTGLLIMVGRPMWAAIADALQKGDKDWMRSVVIRYYQYLFVLVLLASVALTVVGPWLIPFLYGKEFALNRLLLACHSLLLLATGWRLVNRYILIGLGDLPKTVVPILAGLAVGLVLGVAGLANWGLWALLAGMAAATLLIPGVSLPRLVWKRLKGMESGRTVLKSVDQSGDDLPQQVSADVTR
jgi:O-antigen/teichoic acid export membrane protein